MLLNCRLPTLSSSWTTNMTSAGSPDFLSNLETFKLEWCESDMQFVRYLLSHSPLKNLSVRGSYLYGGDITVYPLLRGLPPPRTNSAQVLKLLDVSSSRDDAFNLLIDWVLNDDQCKITHLFMEERRFIPRRLMPPHLVIEVLSVAGYDRPSRNYDDEETFPFLDIQAWGVIPSMREINASGCKFDETQRNSLITNCPRVVFDFRKEFHESSRFYF